MPEQIEALAREFRDLEATMTVDQFCEFENISRASFFKMLRNGTGPSVLRVPNTRILRVTAQARREWERRAQEKSNSEAGNERRIEVARRAGKVGGARPKKKRIAR
jgi:hypothetical protein